MTDAVSNQNLGTWFHDYRENLGLSLRAAAGDSMSAARLSRFERGQSEISTEAAVTLMFNLGMNRTEIRNLNAQNPYSFPLNLIELLLTDDRAAIQTAANRFLNAHISDPDTYLKAVEQLIFQCATTDVTSDFQLSTRDEIQLHKFLAYPQSWGTIEATAIFTVLPFASTEFRNFCRAGIAAAGGSLPLQTTVGLAIALAAAKFGDRPALSQRLQDLDAIVQPRWNSIAVRQIRPALNMLQLVANAADQETVTPNFMQMLANLETVGAGAMLPWLQRYWQLSWHPHASVHSGAKFTVAHQQEAPAAEIGPHLRMIRHQRGLNLTDVCLHWSTAAQSRFENGASQLSFNRTQQLNDFLLTEWSQLGRREFSINAAAFNAITALKARDHNLSQATAAPVIAHLEAQMAQAPATVRTLRVLPVRIYSYAFNYDHVPEALIAQAGSILLDAKRWNQAYYTLFTCASGNMDYQLAYKIWRGLIGADAGYHSAVGYRDLLDFYIALTVIESGDTEIAAAMLTDMQRAAAPKIISVQTMFTKLAKLLCQATITPGRAVENQIETFLRKMIELGYLTEVQEQIPNFANFLNRPGFMADVTAE